MKKRILALAILFIAGIANTQAQYNPLWIPDTLAGPNFDLTIRDTFSQILPGNQTITAAVNKNRFWGPTLIMYKGQVVRPTVHNQLADTTTIHWHGMHLPAIMDGGPHQTIPPYTTWSPYWQVQNNAGTYWYHPHMHRETLRQLVYGVGGLIIIRDNVETALNLPRKYGVDDIPLVFTDRSFDPSNQFIVDPYGDSQLTNGVLHAQYTVPAQVVRFRLLGGSTERAYNFGFTDHRMFHVIASDGGLLDTPVAMNLLTVNEGERYEVLVDFTGQNGTTIDIMSFNTMLATSIPGSDTIPHPDFNNALSGKDFRMLHLNVGPQTAGAITTIPATLTTNSYYSESSANYTRHLTISDSSEAAIPGYSIMGVWAFLLNHRLFEMNHIDYQVPLNNTEIWEIKSTSFISHPFHIHDVEFHILDINGVAPPDHMAGWKDVISVPAYGVIRFITRFDNYSDPLHPYMFHCHLAMHEDEGMMGQFTVGRTPTGIMDVEQNRKMNLFPNPATSQLNFEMCGGIIISHASVINISGQVVKEADLNTEKGMLDVADLPKGQYFLRLTDKEGGSYIKSYLMQ